MKRRTALATVGGGLYSVLSGCSAVDAVVGGCREGRERFDYDGTVHGNTWSGFKLSARPDRVSMGDEITFKLINIMDEPQETGTSPQYLIERHADGGWRSIYWVTDTPAYFLIDRTHALGEGFAWTFRATRSGFDPGDPPGPDTTPNYAVCTDITPGTYRFVYFGVEDAAMAVEFKILDS